MADVTVALRNVDDASTQQTVTDRGGRFTFKDLIDGRYAIHATKPGHVGRNYGARARNKPGVILAVRNGGSIVGLDLELSRGSAISGRITDQSGAPIAGIEVSAIERIASEPQSRWSRAAVGVSDDRGMYRLYGLGDGEYVVGVLRPRVTPGVTSRTPPARPANPFSTPSPGPANTSPRPGWEYSPVFFPGTPDVSAATAISIRGQTDRSDLNLMLQSIPAAEIQGRLSAPPTLAMKNVRVILTTATDSVLPVLGYPLTRTAAVSPNGHFVFSGVPQGTFRLLATTSDTSARGGPSSDRPDRLPRDWSALTAFEVGNDRLVTLDVLRMVTGSALTGRVSVEALNGELIDLGRVAVQLHLDGSRPPFDLPPVRARADGLFTITGVLPGRYTMTASITGRTTADRLWHADTISVKSRDVLDRPFEIQPGDDISDVKVVMTNRVSELTGTMTDPSGRPTSDYYVLVFSSDSTHWSAGSRWLRTPIRPDSDGQFRFVGLPAGEYRLAAVTDYNPLSWWTSEALQQVAASAIRVKLAAHERRTQDIRISRTQASSRVH